jgi:hypothetical protein
MSAKAGNTPPTKRLKYQGNRVADRKSRNPRPQKLNLSGRLVAEHQRHGPGAVAINRGEVGVTQTGCTNLDTQFTKPRRL